MDTHELRVAFTAAEQMPTKFRELHENAVRGSRGVDMPFGLIQAPYAVVSIIPTGLFRETRNLALDSGNAVAPVTGSPNGYRALVTLEGVILYTTVRPEGGVKEYVITHRAGRMDAAWVIGELINPYANPNADEPVEAQIYEEGFLSIAGATASRLKSFSIEGPWVVMVTLGRINERRLVGRYNIVSQKCWRDEVMLPQLIVERLNEASLLPLLRAFWLVFGMERPTGMTVMP